MSYGMTTLNCNAETSKSLLFQFILSEFITSYNEVLTIHQLTTTLKADSNTNKQLIPCLKSCLLKLVSSHLKNYCAEFSRRVEKCKMHLLVNKAFIGCIEGLDTIQSLEEIDGSFQNIQLLDKILNKIVTQMGRFSKLTASLMQKSNDDENIVFFMLRHQTDLDKLYGSRFVFKLIKKMYPKGLEEAYDFLTTQYKRRGFDHLIPRLQKKIAELKKRS